MLDPTLSKARSYAFDPRHLFPMLRDLLELTTIRLLNPRTRQHSINLGRHARQEAFDARDTLPFITLKDLTSYLGGAGAAPLVLPSLDYINLAGLGFVAPYAILASIVGSLQPKRIFETGTFRGVSALTMALNAPEAEIFTLDLPVDFAVEDIGTLTKGDKEWTGLVRNSVGVAFEGHPAAARIHQIRQNSLTFDAASTVRQADFCFIDGGHSYECVKADTENARKILAPGGVILWDDYSWFMDGVRDYVHDLAKELPLKRISGTQYVIYKPEPSAAPS